MLNWITDWLKLRQLIAWADRHGRWLALKPKDIEKAVAFF